MKLKSSFLSGETWVYVLVIGGMLYLQTKGISAEDVVQKGKLIITKIGNDFAIYIPAGLAVINGVKRYLLKAQQLKAKMNVELERIRASAHSLVEGGDGG